MFYKVSFKTAMSLSVIVLSAPYSSQSAYTAYRYVKAALESGHTVTRVFFYQDAVHAASKLATPPQDEFDLYEAWQTLQAKFTLDIVVCIAAAARRGLINQAESKRHNKTADNIADNFEVSGLGQLVEACVTSDKTITFGA